MSDKKKNFTFSIDTDEKADVLRAVLSNVKLEDEGNKGKTKSAGQKQ